ncbi:MAG: hypothetical protein IJL46_00060 [Clostridia bacterium]|nr:hypothetical protein [Clostridia bacterium]MBQ5955947.1 hypothetical protein [Clostridia bacterium]
MGLFSKKDKKTYKIADILSADEIQQIKRTIEPKLASGQYGALPQLMGKGLMDHLKDPMRELSEGKMKGFIKIADSMKTLEPGIAGILQNAINKFNG